MLTRINLDQVLNTSIDLMITEEEQTRKIIPMLKYIYSLKIRTFSTLKTAGQ